MTLKLLWKSAPGQLHASGKYNEPTIARGTVFVGTDRIQAFGLGLNSVLLNSAVNSNGSSIIERRASAIYDSGMSITIEQVDAGQAVYTRRTLLAYDFVVLGLSNRFVWKCPTWQLEAHYNWHVSANHLDVGVGTGYFPDRCRFPLPPRASP